jgi:DNA-binding CsgD family transcriptional regulator
MYVDPVMPQVQAISLSDALSPRELEVFALIGEGLTSKEIGDLLFITEETVKSHVGNLLTNLGARNRAHAVAIALRHGLLVGLGAEAA